VTGFIVRRLIQAVIVTLGVTIITFALLHALPGNLARDGLNKPVYVQYWDFLDKLLHGNLGYSFKQQRTTDSLLKSDVGRDILLGGVSLILSLIIAVPVGILQAVRRNGPADYAATGISFLLYSMPQYAIAILLIQFLSISFHVFPAEAPQGGLFSQPSALVLPIASLTLVSYAQFSRYMRSSALDTLAQDYMRTARAKGLPERLVLWRHLVRNSLLTVITLVGLSIPYILTGTLIIEQVFNYPGVGLLYLSAALGNDYEVMLGITVVVSVVTVLGNLVADVAYALLDPRIRY
jgi:peptide/nickel transport system permease protein